MKINEVENLVGVTKKNIRFYEQEGLLTPRRNSDNGYRDYDEGDVTVLLRIKLLRKLGVPLEEIRRMQTGSHTVGDGMRRHLVTLERERKNLGEAMTLCGELQDCGERLELLDAPGLLRRMETMEQEGTTFMNKQKNDIRRRYVAPVVISLAMVALMVWVVWLLMWAYQTDPSVPFGVMALFFLIPAGVALGVVLALVQRIREIGKGEEDDARKY